MNRKQVVEECAQWCGINITFEDVMSELYGIYDAGIRHGKEGWYSEGDFSSDADWVYGVGSRIQKLEELYHVEDDTIFNMYVEAHTLGSQK